MVFYSLHLIFLAYNFTKAITKKKSVFTALGGLRLILNLRMSRTYAHWNSCTSWTRCFGVFCLHITLPVSVFIICVIWFIPPSPQARQIGKQAPLDWRWKKMIKVWRRLEERGREWCTREGADAPLIDWTSANSRVSLQVIRDRGVACTRHNPPPGALISTH